MTQHAYAQPSDAAERAEVLFGEARALVKARQWAEACALFEESQRVDPALGTQLNLARCYEQIGRLVSAWNLYQESLELSLRVADIKRRNYAQRRAAALELRLPRLSITAPATLPAGFIVTRDSALVDVSTLGTAVYVDPGAHEVRASAPGFEPFSQTLTLAEADTVTVVIPALDPIAIDRIEPGRVGVTGPRVEGAGSSTSSALLPTAIRLTHTARPQRSRGRGLRVAGIATGSAGIVSLGLGALVGYKVLGSAVAPHGGSAVLAEPVGVTAELDGVPRSPQSVASEGAFVGGPQINSDSNPDAPSGAEKPERDRNMPVFVGVGVGAAAVVAGGVLYYYGHRAAQVADIGDSVTFTPLVSATHVALSAATHF